MKRVYSANSLVDATLVADWLAGNGVPCEIFHQNSMGALGELPVTSPEVWVRRDPDTSLARSIIEHEIFPATGLDTDCRQCGENNPAGFDICWQCQQILQVP